MSLSILQAQDIKKEYHGRTILAFEEFMVHHGDRIGIVGANGAGKTTLLEVLMGNIPPDAGVVTRQYQAAYLSQFGEYDATMSGGENKKQQIAQKMMEDNQIIFADEPTANLDADGVAWVKERLLRAAAVVLISHDRDLLDDICNQIIEIKDGKLMHFTGNYSDYAAAVALQQDQALQHREERNKKERQLKEAIHKAEQAVHRTNQRYKRERANNSSEAILGKMRLAGNQKKIQQNISSMKTRVDMLEDVEFIRKTPPMVMDFSLTQPPGNKRLITCSNLNYSYGKKQVLKDVSFTIQRGERVAITGKNGAGKTTLLNQIYHGNGAIHKVPKLKFGYLKQDFDQLEMQATVLENVMDTSVQTETTVRGVLAGLLFFGNDVFKQAGVLSGGEKIKLALAKLLLSDCNGLLLDEPTNFLDIPSLEALRDTLLDYPGIIIFVSHDSRFCKEVATRELEISGNQMVNSQEIVEKPTNTDKILLDMKRTRLVEELSDATGAKKEALEADYQEVMRQLALVK